MQGLIDTVVKAGGRTKGSGLGRVAFLIALGAMLAGCDKCGNLWPLGGAGQIELCREQPPQPR